ncbi:FAD-dependent oxidoreductase [Henriciella mobilis]|uniref:FAD-binding oxidoreductase n=1 Tax=Henriciella mobilis TaxID=2305467 RepID=A0A399RQ29_9PROT|nr:FAD-dependent oxidoreductase [Henriciella mobilis]RIJ32324.1 FAD-binding oxidoreductase [Henriciella mobilis]
MVQKDVGIVGGGFYGCALADQLARRGNRVILFETEAELLTRASRVNQARVHTGFHYPRSIVTAMRSKALHRRFAEDYPEAVVSDFEMVYAIAKRRSKVTAGRFHRMFADMGAPIRPVSPSVSSLLNFDLIEGAFLCQEYAFDWTQLRRSIIDRMQNSGVEVRLKTPVKRLADHGTHVTIECEDGERVDVSSAYNVTYSNINHLLAASGLEQVGLKHELAEIALIDPPEELQGLAVTVMDGPFFSVMPYPSLGAYSLTHVSYTPHASWLDSEVDGSPYDVAKRLNVQSRWKLMQADAKRYIPSLEHSTYRASLFDVKTVLVANERDDGRPILFRKHDSTRIFSVMGSKIDNIYDLFDVTAEDNRVCPA